MDEGIIEDCSMVTILLASYNGEKYIKEQIDSLLNQTYRDFIIHISDDGSTDDTFSIIQSYTSKYPDMISVVQNESNSRGAAHNFMNMMIGCKNDYIMLCDQDDVWLPNKIEITLDKMHSMETIYGKDTPLLVHTDLRVVDENLATISPSFRAAMNANYEKTALNNQIIQNTLTGCTVMYNRALSELITKMPSFMVMHDWWLMLVAAAFGKITALNSQTVLYRQHGDNEIGAKDVRTLRYKVRKLLNYSEIRKALNDTYAQAQSVLDVYRDKLSADQIALIESYCDIPNQNKVVRWIMCCRLGVLKNGIARKIANFIFI